MGKPNWAQQERKELADLFEVVGPDAPTLCGDWTTRDLAAHLVARESRPDAALGIVFKPLASWGTRVQNGIAEQNWPELVDEVRNGPPTLSAFSLPGADRAMNTTEYYVHHEDVRRAQPDWNGTARALDPMFSEEIWTMLRGRGSLLFRRAPVGVLLKRTNGRGGQTLVHPGRERVTIAGPAQELLLYSFGRRDQALVSIKGSEEALARLSATNLSV